MRTDDPPQHLRTLPHPTDGAAYAALDLVSLPVWVMQAEPLALHWANSAARALYKAASQQALAAALAESGWPPALHQLAGRLHAGRPGADAPSLLRWPLPPGGAAAVLSVQVSAHRLPDGRPALLCEALHGGGSDVASMRSVQALLHTAVMITLYDAGGEPLYRNPAASASARAPGERLDERFADQTAFARVTRQLRGSGHAALTLPVATTSGRRWHEVSARRCQDAITGAAAILVSEVDVTPLKNSEAWATYLSVHDALTGLPNRTHAHQHFARLVREVPQGGRHGALVVIDLDHFKNVNDALGHAVGDELLVKVAERLRGTLRRGDFIARFGGDEFLVLTLAEDVRTQVERIHRRIQRALSRPLALGDTEIRVSATLGAAGFPGDGSDFDTLLRHADLAMYAAKSGGRDALAWYAPAMDADLHARNALEQDLRRALLRHEFELHYQPRVCAVTDRVVGAEALVRWRHPQHGMIAPDRFIPLAESTGLIRELGRWVFAQAARQAAAWAAAGHELVVSVNLSPREFLDPQLIDEMAQGLRETGCPARRLQVEITESMLMSTDDRPLAVLQQMVALGLSIALDDFGTGYSNLAYLQRFPIHTLKIDKAFVNELPGDRALAEFVVELCRLLRLTAVAEGVETTAQRGWLRQRGVPQYQGFLFAPPLPAPAFEALLTRVA